MTNDINDKFVHNLNTFYILDGCYHHKIHSGRKGTYSFELSLNILSIFKYKINIMISVQFQAQGFKIFNSCNVV